MRHLDIQIKEMQPVLELKRDLQGDEATDKWMQS